MKHIYDWLEEESRNEAEEKVREFLDFRTRPAVWQFEHKAPALKVFCEYEGYKYLITGASRMGDVWLAKNFDRISGYDKRVDIEDCSNFSWEATQ